MLKNGKYRALRNIPIGWVVQAIHSTDNSEKIFRITIELLMFVSVYYILSGINYISDNNTSIIMTILVVHSFTWFFSGNFLVYLLDSFSFVKNPGIVVIIKYVVILKNIFIKFECCDAILIYGSMCRSQFHDRSDLDLRIVRRTDSLTGFIALIIGYFGRVYSFFLLLPVDLQVVDSFDFLNIQMRCDEKPIKVYLRDGIDLLDFGMDFEQIQINPSIVFK